MLRSKRLYANILVFGSFLLLPAVPWYVPFLIGLVFLWYIQYYELILLGFLIDISYGSAHFFSLFSYRFPLPFTVLGGALVLIFQIVKKRVRLQA